MLTLLVGCMVIGNIWSKPNTKSTELNTFSSVNKSRSSFRDKTKF